MSITTTKPAINPQIVFSNEKGSSEPKQVSLSREILDEIGKTNFEEIDTEALLKEIMASEEFLETELTANNSSEVAVDTVSKQETEPGEENGNKAKLKNFFKTIKPITVWSQYGIAAGSILLHSSSVATILAKKIQDLTGNSVFGLANIEEKLTKDAAWFCRYIDTLPSVLSGIENMLENKTFSLGLARSSSSMKVLFPNIANRDFGGGLASAHNSQKFLNDRALKAGFIDELVEAKEDTKAAHFQAFLQNSLNVSKASIKNIMKGEHVFHSFSNLAITPLALMTFGLGVTLCRGEKLKIVPKKVLRSLNAFGMVLFNVLMIKLGKDSKKTDIDSIATNKADSNLAKLGIFEGIVGGLTGWVEDSDFLLKFKSHLSSNMRTIINLGWNNRDRLINTIKKGLEANPNPA
ncbi:MAG: hypothetical protein HRT47_08535 [Candidatus Caenarcaniphilales bacterium]|nr:hypothetical protein [Candidatus Caenarcaniphilales bacterium]